MQGSADEILSIFLVATAVILLLIASVAVFVVVYQRRVMAQQARIQEVEAEAQRARASAMLEAQEHERIRIAKDLHDGVAADMSAVKMLLNLLSRQLAQPQSLAEGLQQGRDMIDASVESVRRISHNLLPPALETLGLVEAVQSFGRQTMQSSGITVRVQAKGERRRLPIHHELSLFRIVQEFCQNSIRHGDASQIDIDLEFEPHSLQLHFADNGRGFDPAKPAKGAPGIGLSNVQSRIAAMDGTLQLRGAPGQGMQAHIRIPYAPHQAPAP